MASDLSIDTKPIEQALEIGSKCAKANGCRQSSVAETRYVWAAKSFLELAGKLEWEVEYDYKRARLRR